MIFNAVGKKIKFTLSVALFSSRAGARPAFHSRGCGLAAAQEPGSNRKTNTQRDIHTGAPVLSRWLQLPLDCWPKAAKQNSRSQEKARIESWRSRASEATGENCSYAVPGAELYGEKRLQSAWKLRKSSSSNSNALCLCNKNSKLLT